MRTLTRSCERRRREADEFYRAITPANVSDDAASVMRQAFGRHALVEAILLLDVDKWLEEHGADPMRPGDRQRCGTENGSTWSMTHIISMPDKWEYPWFAAWDLAFHTIALSHGRYRFRQGTARPDAAASAICIPTGQIPAYEWNFSDVNPPVHAWATIFLYRIGADDQRARAISTSSSDRFQSCC